MEATVPGWGRSHPAPENEDVNSFESLPLAPGRLRKLEMQGSLCTPMPGQPCPEECPRGTSVLDVCVSLTPLLEEG